MESNVAVSELPAAVVFAVLGDVAVVDQLVELDQFPVPPEHQYFAAITQQGWGFHPGHVKPHHPHHACNLVVVA